MAATTDVGRGGQAEQTARGEGVDSRAGKGPSRSMIAACGRTTSSITVASGSATSVVL
ncbi:hypothetical protein NKG94_14140 [Micromonospora sp. M12]